MELPMKLPVQITYNFTLIDHAIQSFGEEAVALAGGCIRDTLFNAPIKDVDLYILVSFQSRQFTTAIASPIIHEVINADSLSNVDTSSMRVFRHEEHPDVDIIFINSQVYSSLSLFFIEAFDCSLCQVWYNFKTGFGASDLFKTGRQRKTNYWYNARNSFTSSDHRARVEHKYPTWSHVDV
jgi:hypothetical protein